ncbi:helix-turn-helix transcriptional regulator [Paucilactobacillus sp. N302-9]
MPDVDLNKYIGTQIKKYREMNSMTQVQLADKLKTTRQTISRYESGERKTTQDVLFDLAKVFHISINAFFPSENQNTSANVIAAHIDDDTPDDERQQIINFIESLKKARPQD